MAAPGVPNVSGKIVGLDGRVLARFTTDQSGHAAVSVGHLPAGVYIVLVGQAAEKLVIQK